MASKFTMKSMLNPVGCNRLLDRLLVAPCHSAEYFLPVAWRNVQAVSNARINPRRAQAFNLYQRKHHEKNAVEASGSMSCYARLNRRDHPLASSKQEQQALLRQFRRDDKLSGCLGQRPDGL
jgi:hypothetical protein